MLYQRGLFGGELCGGIGSPLFIEFGFGSGNGSAAVCCREGAGIGFMNGIHHIHGKHVGDDFQLFQGDNPVLVSAGKGTIAFLQH